MAKVSVATVEKASTIPAAETHATFGEPGDAHTRQIVGGAKAPLRLHLHELAAGATLTLTPPHHALVAYIWTGAATCAETTLPAGSSALVERGATLTLTATEPAQVLAFTSAAPGNDTSARQVHLLPAGNVPRLADLGSGSGVGGGMHANGAHPTCPVWLHENHFPGMPLDTPDPGHGVHCHSEDEIIIVTAGQIRLGNRLSGPGTALAIAADTMYSFLPGPTGLSFINFRAARPSDIRFANGQVIDEVQYWATRVPAPAYC